MKFIIISILTIIAGFAYGEPATGDLKGTFFFRSIGNLTTNSYFVEAQIFDQEKKEFEKRFLIAGQLIEAIIEEHEFTGGHPHHKGWEEAVIFALKQRGQGFVFEKKESQDLVQQIFSPASLQKCRDKVAEAGLENVLFYLSGWGRGGSEEAKKWFEEKEISPSDLGPLTQVLYENGYYPYEGGGWLTCMSKRQYKESLGDHFTFLISLNILDPETPILEPVAAGQRR